MIFYVMRSCLNSVDKNTDSRSNNIILYYVYIIFLISLSTSWERPWPIRSWRENVTRDHRVMNSWNCSCLISYHLPCQHVSFNPLSYFSYLLPVSRGPDLQGAEGGGGSQDLSRGSPGAVWPARLQELPQPHQEEQIQQASHPHHRHQERWWVSFPGSVSTLKEISWIPGNPDRFWVISGNEIIPGTSRIWKMYVNM